jgi:hypothetical protein
MAQRTYLVGLWLVLKAAYRYISRWQEQLEANTETPTFTCIIAVLEAIEVCLPLIKPAPPT